MKGATPHIAVASLVLLVMCTSPGAGDDVLAVKAERIITMAGAPISGGTILIADGKIKRIGTDIRIPEEAAVIEAAHGVVMPGLVDANARFGIRGDANEQSDEITPAFRISGAIDSDSKALKRAVQLGVTTLRIAPGNANVIAGSGAVIKSTGDTLDDMLVAEGRELTVVMGNDAASGNRIPRYQTPDSFYYRQPTTRMGVVWLLRKALFDTQMARKSGEELSPAQRTIADAMRGKVPIHVAVRSAVDIETTFHIADEFGLRRLVLLECTEGYKLAEEVGRRGVPVVLGPLYHRARGWDVNWNNAGLLAEAGVKVALASNDSAGPANLLTYATMAARHGLPAQEALRSVTVNPAQILGLADRVGTLAKGRDADLLILSGEPLSVTTSIETVIIKGRVVFDAQSGANADG